MGKSFGEMEAACRVRQAASDPLGETASRAPGRYFWTGNGRLSTAAKDYQGRLLEVFKLAGLDKGQTFMLSHRFRDTFATELLLSGAPIERVSILLGHSSVRTTERHYSPWIKTRQEQLERDMRAMWANQQGTIQVQQQNALPN